jgi:hypothetical protein
MKKLYFSCLFILVVCITNAQDLDKEFNEFNNGIGAEFDSVFSENTQEFRLFIDSTNAVYIQLIEKAENEFMDLLRQSFADYKLIPSDRINEEPKPFKIPVKKDTTPAICKLPIKEILLQNPGLQDQVIIVPSIEKNDDTATVSMALSFLGHNLIFPVDSVILQMKSLNEINFGQISDYYAILNKTKYNHLIQQLIVYKDKLNLNDWGYFLMVEEMTKSILGDANTQKLVAWHLLLKTGYRVKLGMAENKLYILFASRQKVYEMPYLVIGIMPGTAV